MALTSDQFKEALGMMLQNPETRAALREHLDSLDQEQMKAGHKTGISPGALPSGLEKYANEVNKQLADSKIK